MNKILPALLAAFLSGTIFSTSALADPCGENEFEVRGNYVWVKGTWHAPQDQLNFREGHLIAHKDLIKRDGGDYVWIPTYKLGGKEEGEICPGHFAKVF